MVSFVIRKSNLLSTSICILLLLGLVGNGQAQSDWKRAWEKTVNAAKKEGQVNIYMYGYWRVFQEFQKKYPKIKVVSVTGSGSQMAGRIMAERRAGKYIADVFSSGANTNFNVLYKGKALQPLKPAFILPEVLDKSRWYERRLPFTDPKAKYIFAFIANPSSAQFYYNTNLFNPKEFKSFWELLDPKLKGEIVSLVPTNTSFGGAMQFLYRNTELGPEFIKRIFGEMDITFSANSRQMTDWLAKGKFALCMGCRRVQRAKRQGLPVDDLDTSTWKEGAGLSVSGGTLSLFNRAPHPNAAKVFVNWFLSQEGQMALQELGNPDDPPNSRRIDIPKDRVSPSNKMVKGRKYLDILRPEWQDMTPIFKLAKEVMKEVKKGRKQ